MQKLRVCWTALLFVMWLGFTLNACAQAPADSSLAFEIVSIRPDPGATPGHDQAGTTPDGWHLVHGQIIAALLTAYVPTTPDAMMYTGSTLVGVPDWVKTELYTIDAKVAQANLAAWRDPLVQSAMLRAMTRAMLADRCKLVVHRSTKEVTVYSIVVGKGGARLQDAAKAEAHAGGFQIPGGGEFVQNDGQGNMAFYDAPVQALAVVFANIAGRPVQDETGLTGRYDMKFRRPALGAAAMEADQGPNPPPTIFEVAESFGLKLVARKSTVETLTIDHIERPSAN